MFKNSFSTALKSIVCIPLALSALSGCGATGTGSGDAAAPTETVTITEPTATITKTKKAPKPAAAQESDKPAASGKKRLPNVVGVNLQLAQDTMQATGFYVLDDQDATGQGRLQIYDRNWVVTRQRPAAGKVVATDTLIVLYAKKIGE